MAAVVVEYLPKLQKRKLNGHRKPVLCLAHSSERLAYHNSAPSTTTSSIKHHEQSPSAEYNTIHHPSLLLSGSEDGTARLWDLRTRKTSLCMVLPQSTDSDDGDNNSNEVVSVAFHPSINNVETRQQQDNCKEEVTSQPQSSSIFPNDCTVYATTSNRIYGYDLRYHSITYSTSPIIKTPHFDLTSDFACTDEINQLSFSFPNRQQQQHGKKKKGGSNNDSSSGGYHMSAADDSGEVHIIDGMQYYCYDPEQENANNDATTTSNNNSGRKRKNKKTIILNHAEPSTMGITSSATFQPSSHTPSNDSSTYIASAGTDCTIKLFDISKPKRPTSNIHIKPIISNDNSTTNQLCNPPYIHSLSWSSSGKLLAAGIGDGSIIIMNVEGKRNLVEIGRLGCDEDGHGSAVAAVAFANFGLCDNGSSNNVKYWGEADDRLLISAGNDGNIIFWDLGGNMVGSGPVDPVLYLDKCLSPPSDDNNCNEDGKDVKDATQAMEVLKVSNNQSSNAGDKDELLLSPSPPRVLFKIAHGYKPNWITTSRASDVAALPTSLFVADTTNNISVYTLPL